jgi:hypothetical protein
MLEKGNMKDVGVAASILASDQYAGTDILPAVLKALEKSGGSGYKNRNIRSSLGRVIKNIGHPSACKAVCNIIISSKLTYETRVMTSALASSATLEQLPFVIKALSYIGPDNKFRRVADPLIEAIASMNAIEGSKALVPFLESKNEYRAAFTAISQLKDPVIASDVCRAYNNLGNKEKRIVKKYIDNGYPGLKYDKKEDKLLLVSDEKLKKLIENRNKQLKLQREARKKIKVDTEVF